MRQAGFLLRPVGSGEDHLGVELGELLLAERRALRGLGQVVLILVDLDRVLGIANLVAKLIELVVAAPDRESLVMRTRALDRVLLWNGFVAPLYYSTEFWIAYWNRFGRPEKLAKYNPRGITTWWFDAEKDKVLRTLPGGKQ